MSKFKVGDKVQIGLNSEYYGKNISNPKDVVGDVVGVSNKNFETYNIKVKWNDQTFNTYRESDLELVEQKPEFKIGHGAICIKKAHEHNVGDVLLIDEVTDDYSLSFEKIDGYFDPDHFTPCPNPPRPHYKERIAHALGAEIEIGQPDGSWDKNPNPFFLGDYNYRVSIPNAEKRAQLQAEIARLQVELKDLGGDL